MSMGEGEGAGGSGRVGNSLQLIVYQQKEMRRKAFKHADKSFSHPPPPLPSRSNEGEGEGKIEEWRFLSTISCKLLLILHSCQRRIHGLKLDML